MKKIIIAIVVILAALPLHSSFAQKKFVRAPLVESPKQAVVSEKEWLEKENNSGGWPTRVDTIKTPKQQSQGGEGFVLDGS